MRNLKNFTLEISAKPFKDNSIETMCSVINTMFSQWDYMCKKSDEIFVLLFLADGSEIFEWNNNLEDTFEWAYWLGAANHLPVENVGERFKRNTHCFPKKYIENPQPKSYKWIKTLIATIKDIGEKKYNKPIKVGYLYDNGPEFALSDFKYNRHKEIAQADTLFPNSFVVCTAKLHKDTKSYAAFPNGIEENTSIGTFLGKQFMSFAKNMGIDFLWLSNGMGFGTETWNITGSLFDKKQFYNEKIESSKELMLEFWHDFMSELGDFHIRTRGTNFSAGLEISTDAAPLDFIYSHKNITAPVNSPWAAINKNVGLELSAWMSHIAKLPNDYFIYRFYIHDPWFMNSPWIDRYEKQPWDIYLPMSVSRINEKGKVETPNTLSILSIDNSWGELIDEVPLEVLPHLKRAYEESPDGVSPLVWVYPFDKYNEIENPQEIFNEDMFIGESIQSGLPLNCVIELNNFISLFKEQKTDFLLGSILIVPASAFCKEIKEFVHCGGSVVLYGSLNEESGKIFNLEIKENVIGKVRVINNGLEDNFNISRNEVYVHPQFCNGGLRETLSNNFEGKVIAKTEKNILACLVNYGSGKIGFVKSILPCEESIEEYSAFSKTDFNKIYPTQDLLRSVVSELGFKLYFDLTNSKGPQVTVHRYRNGFVFSCHAHNLCCVNCKTYLGSPVFTGIDTEIKSNGESHLTSERCFRYECRMFVENCENSIISGNYDMETYPEYAKYDRRFYSGLKNATVRYFLPNEYDKVEFVACDSENSWWTLINEPLDYTVENTKWGKCYKLENVTGTLFVMPMK